MNEATFSVKIELASEFGFELVHLGNNDGSTIRRLLMEVEIGLVVIFSLVENIKCRHLCDNV